MKSHEIPMFDDANPTVRIFSLCNLPVVNSFGTLWYQVSCTTASRPSAQAIIRAVLPPLQGKSTWGKFDDNQKKWRPNKRWGGWHNQKKPGILATRMGSLTDSYMNSTSPNVGLECVQQPKHAHGTQTLRLERWLYRWTWPNLDMAFSQIISWRASGTPVTGKKVAIRTRTCNRHKRYNARWYNTSILLACITIFTFPTYAT